MLQRISIIIPAFNEEKSITETLNQLKNELTSLNVEHEIIVINDGSTDKTKELSEKIDYIKLINHPYNKGYGASLKTGTLNAQYEWLLFFDADGQHNFAYIKKFIECANNYDLIAGDRSNSKYSRPMLRKPGLWLLKMVANYLVHYKIPDLNCGLRLVKKSLLKNYIHLMPDGFSFSTTSTMAFLKDKKNVKFIPIEVNKRQQNSKSTVKSKDAITTLMLMFRLIMIFSPLRIFFPTSSVIFILALISGIYDILIPPINITDITILLFTSSMFIFFFGLLADQIAANRRELNN